MRQLGTALLVSAFAFATCGTAVAQIAPADNIPNWSVPETWSPSGTSGAITTMTDATSALPFVGIAPCRLADTRGTLGFTGQAGPPVIPSNTTRNFQITGSPAGVPAFPNGCTPGSIPAFAQAVSFQFTVVSPSAAGNLIAWPTTGPQPSVSSLNWDVGAIALGNGTIIAVSGAGSLSVRLNMAVGQSAHLVIDVNGYFTSSLLSSNFFNVTGNNPIGSVGFFANSYNGIDSSSGVRAQAGSTGAGTAGVFGLVVSTSGNTFGGKFSTSSADFNSAGVKGISGYGDALGDTLDCNACFSAGSRGVSDATGYGVLGLSRGFAVGGILLDPTDVTGPLIDSDAEGFLGYRSGPTVYGVFYNGGTGGTGIKSFIEPHATDPSKVIRYVSLEGPEAGTYFRGKGRFSRGLATIEVPEDFRMVTDREGLSIQVTPIGEMATVAVVSIGLDRIVVKASRNVEFFYTVNGVRATFKDHTPIKEGVEFMPRKAEATMPRYLSEGQRQILIRNGTYKADGTVNLETAKRLGWDRVWAEAARSPEVPQPH